MPEGPEVKRFVDQLNSKIGSDTLTKIQILSGRYQTHGNPDGMDVFIANLPLQLESVSCKGKFIYWSFKDTETTLWSTLGMTGSWSLNPSHARVLFMMKDKYSVSYNLYFSDIRNFGTIKFSHSKLELVQKLNSIGPDMLSNPPDLATFSKIIRDEGDKNICKAVMDQSIISGVGNYVKAESLYLSKISPARLCNSLSNLEIENLYNSIRNVLTESYQSGGSTIKTYSDMYGNTGSYSGRFLVYGKKSDPIGNPVIKTETLDGRTTHWVPSVQF